MKSIIVLILITMSLPLYAGDCKTHRSLTVAEQIASLRPSAELVPDIDVFMGNTIAAGYDYAVEPAYTAGLYSRTDGWILKTKLTPEGEIDLGDNDILKVSGGMKHETMASFIRFFKDPCRAMLAKPYGPKRIPFKAKTALSDQFRIGDYFLFRGSVGYIVSGEILSTFGSSIFGLSLSGNYVLDGYYQVHIVRLDDTHIRMKVIGKRGRKAEANLGIGVETEISVFKVDLFNNALEDIVDIKPIELKTSLNNGHVFMVDYVLDLSDQEVARAYEEVIKRVKSLKSLSLAKPFKKIKDVEADVVLNLAPLEELYRRDFGNGNSSRITRNLRTNAEQTAYSFGIDLGGKILGFRAQRDTDTMRMSLRSPDDHVDKYLLKAWDRNWSGDVFLGWMASKHEDGMRMLLRGNNDFEDLVPVGLVKHVTDKKSKLSYANFKKMVLQMKKLLPREVFQTIPWEKWRQLNKETHLNFGMRFELHMSPETLLKPPQLNVEEIKVLFRDHMLSKGLKTTDYFPEGTLPDGPSSEEEFSYALNKFAINMEKILNQGISMTKKLDYIAGLRGNKLYSDSGLSFMMSLLPGKMSSWYFVDLNISSNRSSIDFTYGDAELSTLYKKILTIKAALDDEAIDLLKEAESISDGVSGLLSHAE